MAEGLCAQCARYFLIVFNFIFWLSGGAIMGMGIYLLVSEEDESTLSGLIDMNVPMEVIYTSAYIMIGVGSFVFFIGFCGCCGAMRESAIMLAIYIICMGLVMIGEITAGIYVAVEKSNIQATVLNGIAFSVHNYTGSGNSTIDFLQVKFHCCGSVNYTDYQESVWFMEQSAIDKYYIPKTCCAGTSEEGKAFQPEDYEACNLEAQSYTQPWETFDELHPQGCFKTLLGWLDDQSWTPLIGVVVGVGVIEIIGIVLAVVLCRNRTEYYD